ncbi:MAG: CRISPR-associated protein Csx14, partial [Caldilineae bacterium]
MKRQALIATLGTEPQVVTLALDLLRAKGYPIAEVVVVHTAGQVIEPALRRLQVEFAREPEVGFRTVGVEDERGMVEDVGNEADTTAVLRTIYRTVLEEKR